MSKVAEEINESLHKEIKDWGIKSGSPWMNYDIGQEIWWRRKISKK